MNDYKILIKFPTRERPYKFFNCMDGLLNLAEDRKNIIFKITCDEDDETMNNDSVLDQIDFYKSFYDDVDIQIVYGKSDNKIHAVNRDMELYTEPWDIVVLTSDDMIPIYQGYDRIIRHVVDNYFPDTDGVIYSPDGYTPLNTLPIIGRKYYERFNYIYNPEYESFFCDNEFHTIAEYLGKHYRISQVLFRHEHPCNTASVQSDNLYIKNNEGWKHDEDLFNERLKRRFDLES